MSIREIPTVILTVVQFHVSGLPKENLVDVTRIGRCHDECLDECQENPDSYTCIQKAVQFCLSGLPKKI